MILNLLDYINLSFEPSTQLSNRSVLIYGSNSTCEIFNSMRRIYLLLSPRFTKWGKQGEEEINMDDTMSAANVSGSKPIRPAHSQVRAQAWRGLKLPIQTYTSYIY